MAQNNGDNINQVLDSIEKELRYLSGRLLNQFRDALSPASLLLSPEELLVWAEEGLSLARFSPPLSTEAATEYFRATPEVLDILPFPYFLDWVRGGKTLCRACPSLTTAYFQASPRTLAMLSPKMVEVWLDIGRNLCRDTPESITLARNFFLITPDLLQSVSLPRVERLVLFLKRLTETSYELAAECLSSAPQVLARTGKEEQETFLALALTLARASPEGSVSYFTRGTEVLSRIDKGQRRAFLSLTAKLAKGGARHALSFFLEGSSTFQAIDSSLHYRLLNWSETVLAISSTAAIEFIKNYPKLLAKVGNSGLEHWLEEGVGILRQDQEAGLAYFRLESVDEKALERLSARVDLEEVNRILLMYSQALAGTKVQIRSTEDLGGWNTGWIHSDKPTTDGTTIFVPLSMDRYSSQEQNFTWYKVAVTHQAGHIEFGTFNFSLDGEASLFSNRRHQLPSTDRTGLTDIVKFFCLFDDIKLSIDVFTMVEDVRIDHLLKQQYAGIRDSYQWIQQESLSKRPHLTSLPLREAFLEMLIRVNLGDKPSMVPFILSSRLKSAVQILKRVQSTEATVEDSAEATLRLYEIINTIPNKHLSEWQWVTADLSGTEFVTVDISSGGEDWDDISLESDEVLAYQTPAEVEFRGSFNPELVQMLQKPEENPDYLELDSLLLTPEEVQINQILRGNLASAGLYVTDLPVTAQTQETSADKQDKKDSQPRVAKLAEGTLGDEDGQSFLYDEWDFQACCYLPKWCRVREEPLAEGSTDFFTETLARNSLLAAQVKRQFEMLAPELLKKLNKLHDGEELDLNAVIEAVVDRKSGHIPDEKIYWKRRKITRDVAVIFLIDMSSSTADAIGEVDEEDDYPDWYFTRLEALSRLRTQRAEGLTKGPRRVIDVAKESIVLMINAIETTGDRYGIYGFSGHGRQNVELLVIKGLDEEFSTTVERRIDRIRPRHGTRMGPAIRHATARLEACDAKTKILFLVSDGYPQDEDYGRDRNDKEYALHDTKMAFIEAKRKNITPFCLTIDIAGYDYLKKMSDDIGYEVVNNIESLPERLPALYKRLTS